MKTVLRTGLLIGLLTATGVANADWSVNAGFASEYHYRGIFQKSSSASAGLDYESGGFYAGTWAADVGDGMEVDGYFGYGTEVGDVGLSIGFTGYYYTGDFDDTYQEINLGAGFGDLSFDVAIGEYDNFDGPTQDYTYYSLTYEKNGFYGKYAGFEQDAEGEYFEFGYGATVAEIDLGVSLILANDDLVGDAEESVVFTIGKAFDL
ncbi:MAG: TorF family putative porin [Woeseiaceae bacterium]